MKKSFFSHFLLFTFNHLWHKVICVRFVCMLLLGCKAISVESLRASWFRSRYLCKGILWSPSSLTWSSCSSSKRVLGALKLIHLHAWWKLGKWAVHKENRPLPPLPGFCWALYWELQKPFLSIPLSHTMEHLKLSSIAPQSFCCFSFHFFFLFFFLLLCSLVSYFSLFSFG